MDLDDITNLGNIGLNLYSNARVRSISKQQRISYLREAELNRKIGAINSASAERAGVLEVQGIQKQTAKTMATQVNIFRSRGVELEGSPMLVLGETVSMGEKQAQEAMFNAKVKEYNYQLSAETAAQHAMNKAEAAQMSALNSNLNMITGAFKGIKALNSMSALGKGDILGNIGGAFASTASAIGKIFTGLFS